MKIFSYYHFIIIMMRSYLILEQLRRKGTKNNNYIDIIGLKNCIYPKNYLTLQ
jgi:hypothetical protein